jgi:hypothetical protein
VRARQPLVHLHERLEDRRQLLGRDAGPGVRHGDGDLRLARRAPETHLAATLGELHRVREQVDEHLLQLLAIGARHQRRRLARGHEAQPARPCLRQDERLGRGAAPRAAARRPARSARAGVDARVVEHLVDEAEQVPLARPDAREVGALLVGDRAAQPELDQLRVAADGVERGAQLVRHDGEELALGAVRRLGLGARRALGLVQAGALERLRAVVREARHEGAIVVVEAARAGEAQGERAEQPIVDEQRERGPRAVLHRPPHRRDARRGAVPRRPLGEAADEHRPARAEHVARRERDVGREAAVARLHLLRVPDDAQRLEGHPVGRELDHAAPPRAERLEPLAHDHVGHLRRRERGRERRDDALEAHRAPGRRLLGVEQARPLHRLRAVRREGEQEGALVGVEAAHPAEAEREHAERARADAQRQGEEGALLEQRAQVARLVLGREGVHPVEDDRLTGRERPPHRAAARHRVAPPARRHLARKAHGGQDLELVADEHRARAGGGAEHRGRLLDRDARRLGRGDRLGERAGHGEQGPRPVGRALRRPPRLALGREGGRRGLRPRGADVRSGPRLGAAVRRPGERSAGRRCLSVRGHGRAERRPASGRGWKRAAPPIGVSVEHATSPRGSVQPAAPAAPPRQNAAASSSITGVAPV